MNNNVEYAAKITYYEKSESNKSERTTIRLVGSYAPVGELWTFNKVGDKIFIYKEKGLENAFKRVTRPSTKNKIYAYSQTVNGSNSSIIFNRQTKDWIEFFRGFEGEYHRFYYDAEIGEYYIDRHNRTAGNINRNSSAVLSHDEPVIASNPDSESTIPVEPAPIDADVVTPIEERKEQPMKTEKNENTMQEKLVDILEKAIDNNNNELACRIADILIKIVA